ncbi:MAG: flagellar biosynthesis protein FlhF, partial [Gammaproteobacteria bacterium]
TTTVAKLAGQFTLRHGPGSVALITVDGHRIGTQEQLRSFGRILDIPVAYAQNHTELKDYLTRFANHRLVIVDSAGISHRDPRLAEHMAMFSEGMSTPLSTYLVMAANTQPKALEGAARQFGQFGLSGSIITKLDEAASLGGVINALVDQGLPLSFTSDGQRVPDALQAGSPHDLIRQGIALMRESAEPTPAETNSLTFGPLLSQRYA